MKELLMVWLAVATALVVLGMKSALFGGYYSLFAVGCLLFFVHRDGNTRINVGLLLWASGLALGGVHERAIEIAARLEGKFLAVVPACIMAVAIAVFWVASSRKHPWSASLIAAKIGALTYPLYLLHHEIGAALLQRIGSEANKWLALLAVCALMIAAAMAVAELYETPSRKWWRRFFNTVIGAPIRLVLTLTTPRRRTPETP
jgi:peptidoglycan/LPS O-acetylase OafA/YrhL